jgi:hypothetical protein
MKNGASVSKLWKDAVKSGIFEGSFSEFAKLYNGINSEVKPETNDVFSSDDASFSNDNSAVEDTTKITDEDKKPISEQSPKLPTILGMAPKKFYIVAGSLAFVTAVGVYLFVRNVSSEKTKG